MVHRQVMPHTVLPSSILRISRLLTVCSHPVIQVLQCHHVSICLLQTGIQKLSIAWVNIIRHVGVLLIDGVAADKSRSWLLPSWRRKTVETVDLLVWRWSRQERYWRTVSMNYKRLCVQWVRLHAETILREWLALELSVERQGGTPSRVVRKCRLCWEAR